MDIRSALTQISEAFNAHDLDRIMAFFSDDCILEIAEGRQSLGLSFRGQGKRTASTGDTL